MSRSRFSLVLALLAALTVWGCAQNGSGTPSPAAKVSRLQEEVQGLTTQRDQLRKDLNSVRGENDQLLDEVQKLRVVLRERDQLRETLATRTAERDQGLAQLEQVKRGVKAILEQVEAAAPTPAPALGAAETKPASNS